MSKFKINLPKINKSKKKSGDTESGSMQNQEAPKSKGNVKPKDKGNAKTKGKGKKRAIKKWQKTLGVILIFIVGLGILVYPTVANLWNQHIADISLGNYQEAVKKMPDSEKEDLLKSAHAYNEKLKTEVVPDAFAVRDGTKDEAYEKELAADSSGIMGNIEIPVINVKLPIYHYTTNEILEKGAGHLLGSSLPVGGKGTHTVITAHRGLPSMRLFTDLDLIQKGDEFYIHVLGEHFAYQVDQIITVRPEETSELALKPDKDYATLITCTPYGKNTHRLFVRGHRIPYVPKEVESRASFWRDVPWWARIVASLLGLIIFYVIAYPIYKRKRYKKKVDVAAETWKELFGEVGKEEDNKKD